MNETRNYNTLEMFRDLKPNKRPAVYSNTKAVPEFRKHTINLEERIWLDFLILVKADGTTINEAINKLLEREVIENADFIQSMKNRKKD